MRMIDIIEKKKNNEALLKEEIEFFINGYVGGSIPDYQVSALLMAIYFNGMSDQEVFYLTDAMLNSGEQVDLSMIKGSKCDKHSTGGVGDKTSLVVAPIAAVYGIKMAKMSGRGLGHTGGTLDKLESIPGFQIEISSDDFIKQVNEIGLAIIGQTANITPADKLLYSLRDVTATVNSLPLIASSIMSKKLASGADNIVLDVKVGSGAFMKNIDDATQLAELMVKIGKNAGRNVIATLSDMAQPLGCAVGNSIEIIEAIETLKGHGPKDFEELCVNFAAELILVSNIAKTEEEAIHLAKAAIENGKALEKLREMIEYQHGDPNVIDDYDLLPTAMEVIDLIFEGEDTSYVEEIDALKIGEAAMILGAGRLTKEDPVDHAVGVYIHKKVGDIIKPNDVIATIYSNGKNTQDAADILLDAYLLTEEKVDKNPIILKTVK